VTGGDLRYYLRRKVLFEEKDVAFYVACISSALEHIHSRNMIHRDVKPGNYKLLMLLMLLILLMLLMLLMLL
jgi:serine/threonine kinase 32